MDENWKYEEISYSNDVTDILDYPYYWDSEIDFEYYLNNFLRQHKHTDYYDRIHITSIEDDTGYPPLPKDGKLVYAFMTLFVYLSIMKIRRSDDGVLYAESEDKVSYKDGNLYSE